MTIEEAIHVIQSNRPTSGYTMLCEALDMAVAALREQDERRWIPVTERLPEEGEYVLCVLKGFNYGGKIQVCKFVPADKFKDKPYFENFRNGFPSVTHWMPLPNCRKENDYGNRI